MLGKVLTAPVAGPVAGFRFILEQIRGMAERELLDEGRIREELLLLNLQLEEGEITDEQFSAREAGILARLRAARESREGAGGRSVPMRMLLYLYCIVEAGSPAQRLLEARRVPGLEPAEPLFQIEAAGLVAAVSRVPAARFWRMWSC